MNDKDAEIIPFVQEQFDHAHAKFDAIEADLAEIRATLERIKGRRAAYQAGMREATGR
jgi:hypothetical protein